jgi:hypothetical protein
MRDRLALFAAALWWGAITAICGLAAPLLFRYLPSTALAGMMAARLFTALLWVAMGCGVILLLILKVSIVQKRDERALTTLMAVLAGMLFALLIEFVAAPHIRMHEQLPMWHGVGVALFLLEWLCAGAVLWRLGARREPF